MRNDPYALIGNRLNWDAPLGELRCNNCSDLGSPRAGSYSTALSHFEQLMGGLPGARSSARVLILFQDPPSETKFRIAAPGERLDKNDTTTHKYFCLSRVAWDALGLGDATHSAVPVWPTEKTSHTFLRRYLTRRGPWAYDGFITYFLYRLKPEDALITNAAKCHFSKRSVACAAQRCVATHLVDEAAILDPNLILSFSGAATQAVHHAAPKLADVPTLTLLHPTSWTGATKRSKRLISEVQRLGPLLEELGLNPAQFVDAWLADCKRLAHE